MSGQNNNEAPPELKEFFEALERTITAEKDAVHDVAVLNGELQTDHGLFDFIYNWVAQNSADSALSEEAEAHEKLAQAIRIYFVSNGVSAETADIIASLWNREHKTTDFTINGAILDNFNPASCADKDILAAIPADELPKVIAALSKLSQDMQSPEAGIIGFSTGSGDLGGYVDVNNNLLQEVTDFQSGVAAACQGAKPDKGRSTP